MKKFIQMLICVGSCMFLLPIFVVYITKTPIGINSESMSQVKNEQQAENTDIISEETLIGILAKEIPYTYEEEAIKAQAVVARTYMARRILGIQTNGAVVGYSIDEMKELWGEERFNSVYNIYKQAVEATRGRVILYNNQPIEALYHEASSGRTRDGKSVYNQEIPYLKSVESSVDKISKQVECSKEEAVSKIKEKYPTLEADSSNLESQIQIVSKDAGGYINAVQIGNITLTGQEIVAMFDLPSAAFRIFSNNNDLVFDVKGAGSGVGLSQNGANELAEQGMGYEDIIKYYYTDVSIENYEVQQ